MTISTEKSKILVTREQKKQHDAVNPENKIIRVQETQLEKSRNSDTWEQLSRSENEIRARIALGFKTFSKLNII